MNTILITGANRGLGLEMTKQYAEAQWQVYRSHTFSIFIVSEMILE
jgi:NAD(P)-dependent dehydrogenase (short-subunit alcohol dehydrogenase family)